MNKKDLVLWKQIAEIRGYKFRQNGCNWEYMSPNNKETTNAYGDTIPPHWSDCFYDSRGNDYSFYGIESIYDRSSIPKYIEDLNAVHELEMWLKNDKEAHLQWSWTAYSAYCEQLCKQHGPCANAEQRCRCLINTLFPNGYES